MSNRKEKFKKASAIAAGREPELPDKPIGWVTVEDLMALQNGICAVVHLWCSDDGDCHAVYLHPERGVVDE